MDTILLLTSNPRDRQLLEDYLHGKYHIIAPESPDGLDTAFDLCIVDGPCLNNQKNRITTRKTYEKGVFLPVLLATAKKEVGLLTSRIWQTIDDVISSPVQKGELHARVEVLLRTRRLSLELKGVKDAQVQLARQSLSESEELQKAMIACTPLATYSLDPTGKVLSWNPAAEAMFGWKTREVTGRPLPIAPPGKQAEFEMLMRRILSGESISGMEFVRQRKDGSFLQCNLFGAPIRDHLGHIVGVMASMEDITAHKQLELEYKQLFDGMNDTVFVMDFQAQFLDVNETAVKTLGYTRTELLDMGAIDIDSHLNSGQIMELAEQIQSGDRQVFETRHRTKDGKITPVEISASRVSYQGQPAILCTARDISERKKAEEKQDQLRAQFVQAQKMESVGRLAGGVAHDYNNMLSVIIGYSELALDEIKPGDPLRDDLNEIYSAALRSRDITRQLLAFARKETIAPRVLDLNAAIESMLKILRRLIGEDIDLAWRPGKDLWRILMDPSQIDQMLANLCVNARDAIADVGKITIETGTATFDQAYCNDHADFSPGDFVMLAVSDDGCGMDSETLKNIFEPFFTTKGVGKGTGLGLATVYGIAKQNNGFINVHSEPGQGSTFRIYIPGVKEDVAEKPAEEEDKGPEGMGETVLLVEDEPSILNLTKRLLANLNYKVLTAGSPLEALQKAKDHGADISLLITDVIMPGMNGHELALQLQTLCPKIKCLYMSGYTADIIAHRGILDTDSPFIQKPFSAKDLSAKVRATLCNSQKICKR